MISQILGSRFTDSKIIIKGKLWLRAVFPLVQPHWSCLLRKNDLCWFDQKVERILEQSLLWSKRHLLAPEKERLLKMMDDGLCAFVQNHHWTWGTNYVDRHVCVRAHIHTHTHTLTSPGGTMPWLQEQNGEFPEGCNWDQFLNWPSGQGPKGGHWA